MVGTNLFAERTNADGNQEYVALTDENGLPAIVRGTTVPTSGSYAKGCLFIKTDAGSGTKSVYENQGTTSSISFNLIGSIDTAEIADDAITTAKIKDDNVTEAKISASSDSGLGVLRVARAKYDFGVDGGAQGAITPTINATLPDNAGIIGGTINSTTAATSGGSATVSVGTVSGSSATSLLDATAISSLTADALLNSKATFASPVKLTASSKIDITVGTADLTAGVIEITVLYFVAAA